MCRSKFCFKCTMIKKGDSSEFLKRIDMWWTCNECTPTMFELMKNPHRQTEMMRGGPTPPSKPIAGEPLKSILPDIQKILLEPIREEIEKSISDKIPEIEKSINDCIVKTWVGTGGNGICYCAETGPEDSEQSQDPEQNFCIVVSKQQKRAAAAQI